jgi:hypothetical protein
MTEIPLLLLTGLFILFIATNAKARDIARAYSKQDTIRRNWVLLDDSISLKSMKIKRINGKLGFLRSYSFEFNEADFQRYMGKIELIGYKINSIQYFHPDHIEMSNND